MELLKIKSEKNVNMNVYNNLVINSKNIIDEELSLHINLCNSQIALLNSGYNTAKYKSASRLNKHLEEALEVLTIILFEKEYAEKKHVLSLIRDEIAIATHNNKNPDIDQLLQIDGLYLIMLKNGVRSMNLLDASIANCNIISDMSNIF